MAEPIITGLYVAFLSGFALLFWAMCRSSCPNTVPAAPPVDVPEPDDEQLVHDLEAHLKAYGAAIADLYDTTPGGTQ
jgi:hypothetical protein